MKALHLASGVLPRIVAASYRYQLFPTTRGWAEMMRIDDLPQYADAEGSDIQQFVSMRDQARSMIEGTDTAMRRPEETSRWFKEVSDRILTYVAEARQAAGDRPGNEFISTVTDLKILAWLANYHAERLPAGVCYNLYQQTGDLFALDDAIDHERKAVTAWQRLVEAAGDVYSKNLAFGVHRVGFSRHWDEELEKLRNGLKQLEDQRLKAEPRTEGEGPRIAHVPVRRCLPHATVRLRATVGAGEEVPDVRMGVCMDKGPWRSVAMQAVGERRYQADVPVQEGVKEVRYFIEARDSGGRIASLPAGGANDPIGIVVSEDDQPPQVELRPVGTPEPGRDLRVTAGASDPSGVKSVRLRYRHVTQFEDYEARDMQYDPQAKLWSATIPGTSSFRGGT